MNKIRYFDIHTHQKHFKTECSIYSMFMDDMSCPEEIIHFSAGIHPWYLTQSNADEQWYWLLSKVKKEGLVAIGECGLDKLKGASLAVQLPVFKRCVALAEECSLPLIIHAVKCTEELIQIKKEMKPRMPWIIHGFRGRREVASVYLKHGFYLSFGEYFQEDALRSVPLDRIFLETDESSLSIDEIYQRVAETYDITLDLLIDSITSNVEKVLYLR